MASKNIVVLDQSNFDAITGAQDKPVLVDFWAVWCNPCRAVAPVLEKLADEYQGKLLIGKVNVDENGPIAEKFGITNIPTIILFKGGQVVDTIVGARQLPDYKNAVDPHLSSTPES